MISAVEDTADGHRGANLRGVCLPAEAGQTRGTGVPCRQALERRQLILDKREYTRRLEERVQADRRDSSRPGGDHPPVAFGLAVA